jgi:hypothetical protein
MGEYISRCEAQRHKRPKSAGHGGRHAIGRSQNLNLKTEGRPVMPECPSVLVSIDQPKLRLVHRRRIAAPISPNPPSIIAQVPTPGTAAEVMVPE